MMTDEELQEAREYAICQEYDCPSEDIIKRLLSHIDEQASQIATLKAALLERELENIDPSLPSLEDAIEMATSQLSQEYPEIFAEE